MSTNDCMLGPQETGPCDHYFLAGDYKAIYIRQEERGFMCHDTSGQHATLSGAVKRH